MNFKVFQRKERDAVGFGISPLEGCSVRGLMEDGDALNVLADAIQNQKGKCIIDLDDNILSINFSYNRRGGLLQFYVNDSNNRHLLDRILKRSPLIEVKKRYEIPFHKSNPEENAMIIYLRVIDFPALFKWLFKA